jgi:hypothetical protein
MLNFLHSFSPIALTAISLYLLIGTSAASPKKPNTSLDFKSTLGNFHFAPICSVEVLFMQEP